MKRKTITTTEEYDENDKLKTKITETTDEEDNGYIYPWNQSVAYGIECMGELCETENMYSQKEIDALVASYKIQIVELTAENKRLKNEMDGIRQDYLYQKGMADGMKILVGYDR